MGNFVISHWWLWAAGAVVFGSYALAFPLLIAAKGLPIAPTAFDRKVEWTLTGLCVACLFILIAVAVF